MNREACYGALFTLLQGLAASNGGLFAIVDRRTRLLDEMKGAELPALFMMVANQKTDQAQGRPAKHTLGARLVVYVDNPDRHTAAGIALNNLLDLIEAALAPTPGFSAQTLGGIVQHAWIEGTIEVFEGSLGQKAAAVIPVLMLVP